MFTRDKVAGAGLFLLALLLAPGSAAAGGGTDRQVTQQQDAVKYIWVVGSWDFESCRILTDDLEFVPQYADIAALCGIETTRLLNDGIIWLYYLGEYHYTANVIVELPPIEIKTDYIAGAAVVTAADPLPGQRITRIEALINGAPAVCDDYNGTPGPAGSLRCSFPINRAPVLFSAYAVSSYGDNSKSVTMRIGNRINSDPVFSAAAVNQFMVIGDIAYTQYNPYFDIPLRWGVLPGPDPVPWWLRTAGNVELITSHSYYYLAGQILLAGRLDGQNCYNYGLDGDYANQCGLTLAADLVTEYQNAYNGEIMAAADRYGVPAALIKRVIAVESQFWPGALGQAGENGLYQLTRDGADTILRWSGVTYLEICGLYFDTCQDIPYDNLESWQRDLLANHILSDPNNIDYLAAALKANAYQVDRLIDNILGIEDPGQYFDYVDLWRMAVINYHTGATVTAAIMQQLIQRQDPITWDNYAAALERVQASGSGYITRICGGSCSSSPPTGTGH